MNFWPDMDLDEYINLKSRVETRMKISVMTSTGDDNLISPEEKGDLEYRKAQLKRLQEEVVDIEEMSSGISIMDLGLNEFRLDLLEYIKLHDEVERTPNGMHAVVAGNDEAPAGVIFILKNINNSVNIDNRNRIHPFYMVYIGEDGEIFCDYLDPKKMLDTIRLLCRGKNQPEMALCKRFNTQTNDGRNMGEISELLSKAINSIIDVKEENVHVPYGSTKADCEAYEKAMEDVSVDIQVLGIGANGHIGFNEPGTPFTEETHIVTLTEKTRQDNARFFEGDINKVPTHAITMGIATIMKAKKILLVATGENKADAIKAMVEGEPTTECPASVLQNHKDVVVIVDEAAASKLTK